MTNLHTSKSPASAENEAIIDNKQILKSIADLFCKYYVLCLVLVYAVGTFIYVSNNLVAGFPFVALSVVQYAVLVFYVVMVIALPIVINLVQVSLYRKQPRARFPAKLKTCFRHIGLEYFTLSLAVCAMLGSIVGNYVYILLLAPAYLLAPILGTFRGIVSFLVRTILYSATAWLIILEVPVSAGGLKPLSVEFCTFDTEQCRPYTFFGEANGLYHFRDGNTVILQPVDSGYLRYDKSTNH